MRKIMRFLLLLIFAASSLRGATAPRNVVDYFLLLPAQDFEAPTKSWLDLMKSNGGGVVDVANGYLRCIGDGAQPEFEVALFRFRDGRPLLAVCSGELEGVDGVYLKFYEQSAEGKMRTASRSFIPINDAGSDQGNLRFDLPRHGRTIVVRAQRGGKVLYRYTWNGEKFAEEK